MVTEKQLANLRPPFNSITAREAGAKGGKKKKENELKRLARQEAKERIINEVYGQILQQLEDKQFTKQELIALFKPVIDISGDKTEKQEISTPEALEIKVIKKE